MFNWLYRPAREKGIHEKLLKLIQDGNIRREYIKDQEGEIHLYIYSRDGECLGTLLEYMFRLEYGPE